MGRNFRFHTTLYSTAQSQTSNGPKPNLAVMAGDCSHPAHPSTDAAR